MITIEIERTAALARLRGMGFVEADRLADSIERSIAAETAMVGRRVPAPSASIVDDPNVSDGTNAGEVRASQQHSRTFLAVRTLVRFMVFSIAALAAISIPTNPLLCIPVAVALWTYLILAFGKQAHRG